MYRQGDLLLIRRESNPLTVEAPTDIIMEGTITGHHHRVKKGKIFFKPIDRNHVFAFLIADEDCELKHDEHKTIKLPKGIYEARRQREVRGYVED